MAWFLVNSDDLKQIGGRPVDPGFGVSILPPHPGGGPMPGWGGGPVDPGYGQPAPPHPWLPGHGGGPGIDNSLPGGGWRPVDPGYGRPEGGGGHPWLPGHSRPPQISNELPGHIPGLPELPDRPTKPIDPDAPLTGYVVVFVPGYGYKVVEIPIVPPTEPTPEATPK